MAQTKKEPQEERSYEDLLKNAERAVEFAFGSGKADRAKITQAAQLDAAEAVAMVGIAMEADEQADEAMRISAIAAQSGDRQKAKEARLKERAARKDANEKHQAATASAKRAYDAIRFSAPNKMGFLRVVQILFASHIVTVIVYLMLTSRDKMVYTPTTAIDWIMVILESVAFWMFINRCKVGRPFVIAMSILGIVLPTVIEIATGRFSLLTFVLNSTFYLFLILYFVFSRRVKATLVNDLGSNKGEYEKDDFVIERRGWPFVRNLIIYFIVFSNVGHWMEMAMCQLIIMGVVQGDYDPTNTMLWRDWLFPFAMEGAAVVFIALFLHPLFLWFKKKCKSRILPYVLSFLSNALFCTLVEFIGGLLVNADHQLWDYSDQFGNIMGQVCLQNALAFGAACSLIAWFVYPLLERWIARVSRDVMNIVFVVVLAFGLIVWSLYIIPAPETLGIGEGSTQTPATAQQQERARFTLSIASAAVKVGDLQREIDASTLLTDEERAELHKHLDTIAAEYVEMAKYLDESQFNASAP